MSVFGHFTVKVTNSFGRVQSKKFISKFPISIFFLFNERIALKKLLNLIKDLLNDQCRKLHCCLFHFTIKLKNH